MQDGVVILGHASPSKIDLSQKDGFRTSPDASLGERLAAARGACCRQCYHPWRNADYHLGDDFTINPFNAVHRVNDSAHKSKHPTRILFFLALNKARTV
jgi:hypothetical protein